jgi:hypothetical protein
MPAQAFDWNVVVVGAWNLAILTPQGIARRMFGLEPNVPLQVQVQIAVDGAAPMRVTHDRITVIPDLGSITVQPAEQSVTALERAAVAAGRCMTSLPETPVAAAGVNFRYRFDALPEPLIRVLRSSVDDRLADADERINGRAMKRVLPWRNGVLNMDLQQNEDASGVLLFNYHRGSSTIADLTEWLGQVATMHTHAIRLYAVVLELPNPGVGT